jgi:hypothetical protein
MDTITLEGVFCGIDPDLECGIKLGIYGKLDFNIIDGEYSPVSNWLNILDKQFGNNTWDCFEVCGIIDHMGAFHYTGDYGKDDVFIQLDREEVA